MSNDEHFIKLCNALDKINHSINKLDNSVNRLDKRISVLEQKTTDIHNHIPFVNWLEIVAQDVSSRFRWLSGYKEPPLKQLRNN